MTEQHLARLLVWDVAILIVDHTNFYPREFPTECARANRTRLAAIRQKAHHLRHSPYFDQGEAKALLDRSMELWLDAGPDAEPHIVRPLSGVWWLIVEHCSNNAEVMHD